MDQAAKFGIKAANQGVAKLEITRHLRIVDDLAVNILGMKPSRCTNLDVQLKSYNLLKDELKKASQKAKNTFLDEVLNFDPKKSKFLASPTTACLDQNEDLIAGLIDADAAAEPDSILKRLRDSNQCPCLEDLVRVSFPQWDQGQKISFIAEIWRYNMKVFGDLLHLINFSLPLPFLSPNPYLFEVAIIHGRLDIVNILILSGAMPKESDLHLAQMGDQKEIAERIKTCLDNQKIRLMMDLRVLKAVRMRPDDRLLRQTAKRKIKTNLFLWPAMLLPKAVKAAVAMKNPKVLQFIKAKLPVIINRYGSIIPLEELGYFLKCAKLLGNNELIEFIVNREIEKGT